MSTLLMGSKVKPEHIQLECTKTNRRSKWAMRYLRYVKYPRQIADKSADVHHVLDHGYAHLLPKFSGGASCITVHDLIPLLANKGLIQGTKPTHRPWLNRFSLSYVDRYDAVITPSKSTADDLREHLGVSTRKLHVIPPLIGEQFQPYDAKQVSNFAQQYQLPDATLWLLVSGREFYKNHTTSLGVLKRLNERGCNARILKTGLPSTEFTHQARLLGVADSITEVLFEDVAEMPLAYNFVDCLLFPSLYEGFGMPVVEALACGTPVVCSNRGSLREIAPNLAIQVDPENMEQLTDAVLNAVTYRQSNSDFQAQAQAAIRPYRKEQLQGSWLELYQSLLK